MTRPSEYLWYIPNENRSGHRGDLGGTDHNSLASLAAQARALEEHGWTGALIGTGWERPDTFTVATALTALTERFEPLIAVRPGYWQPAQLACAAATLDRLSGGRVRVNIVSGSSHQAAFGDREEDQSRRYGRTREFMRLVRRLWTEEGVNHDGAHYRVQDSTVVPRIAVRGGRHHPKLYFGGASDAAERVAAAEADVQLFWGEPLEDLAERIARLRRLSRELDRDPPPLEFGLRVTTLVRDSSAEAWADAEARVESMAATAGSGWTGLSSTFAVGQQRLIDLQTRGDVLDDNLYTAPGRHGGGGAGTTWLVGSAGEVAAALRKYEALGISHFILSDTPYLRELERQGRDLLPLLQGTVVREALSGTAAR